MSRKIDRRYAADRDRTDPDAPAAKPYRAGLFTAAKNAKGFFEGFRDIAALTGLSVNTIRDAFAGQCVKIDTLKTLADFYNIPWIALFDLDGAFTVVKKIESKEFEGSIFGNLYAGLVIEFVDVGKLTGITDLATPEKASGSKAGK